MKLLLYARSISLKPSSISAFDAFLSASISFLKLSLETPLSLASIHYKRLSFTHSLRSFKDNLFGVQYASQIIANVSGSTPSESSIKTPPSIETYLLKPT
ncbi:hypothetical protein p3ABAYE0087 (plasmid) [Acinetobacter baumannii AYE]|nr:hypothetical protein p3ABAYE0087 [Acinetobacter baumannii AYE]